jgi:HAMP domain-containing protein
MRWTNFKLRNKLMLVFASYCLLITALFSLYALAFAYSVEDEFFEAMLVQEAQRQQIAFTRTGEWTATQDLGMYIAKSSAELPLEIQSEFQARPKRREFSGLAGRHFHILPLSEAQNSAWLVAEVSNKLVFRRMRSSVFDILIGSTIVMLALALLLAWWLANNTAKPLTQLANVMMQMQPDQLPKTLAYTERKDEVGILTAGLNDLVQRVQAFIVREQEFTKDASHELRTPLSVIRCTAEQLITLANLPASAMAQLKLIQTSSMQLQQTVTSLLSLARESSELVAEPVPVLPVLEHVILEQSVWLDKKAMQLNIEVESTFRLLLPESVLHIVLANLIGNAFQHGEAKSVVNIYTNAGRLWILNQHAVALEPSTGFGLGLSIVRRLAKRFAIDVAIEHTLAQTQVSVAMQEQQKQIAHVEAKAI